jgi:hypothetical protein
MNKYCTTRSILYLGLLVAFVCMIVLSCEVRRRSRGHECLLALLSGSQTRPLTKLRIYGQGRSITLRDTESLTYLGQVLASARVDMDLNDFTETYTGIFYFSEGGVTEVALSPLRNGRGIEVRVLMSAFDPDQVRYRVEFAGGVPLELARAMQEL